MIQVSAQDDATAHRQPDEQGLVPWRVPGREEQSHRTVAKDVVVTLEDDRVAPVEAGEVLLVGQRRGTEHRITLCLLDQPGGTEEVTDVAGVIPVRVRQREERDACRTVADLLELAGERPADVVARARPPGPRFGRGRQAIHRFVKAGLPQQRPPRMHDQRTQVRQVARRDLLERQPVRNAIPVAQRSAIEDVETERRGGLAGLKAGLYDLKVAEGGDEKKRCESDGRAERGGNDLPRRRTFHCPVASPTTPRLVGGFSSGAGTGRPRSASALRRKAAASG